MKFLRIPLLIVLGLALALPFYAQTSQPTETSLSYGLVVDNSGSLRPIMKRIIQASKNVVVGNKVNDETFVIRFVSSTEIERSADFTQNKTVLNSAIEKFEPRGGQTAIIDALYLSAEYLAQKGKSADQNRRRALVLITDGEDRDSYYKMEQLLELLKKEKIAVYVIGFLNEVKESSGKKAFQKATEFISTITKETGGSAFIVEKKEQIEEIANGFLDKIRQP